MAEAIFDALAEDAGLDLRAHSAGTRALAGEAVAPKAREALAEFGIPLNVRHRARQVDRAMVEEADLVLTMTPRHVEEIGAMLGRPVERPAQNVHALPGYASGAWGEGISDPYGHGMTVYRASARQIFEHLDRLVYEMAQGAA
jgi:protein-tyrosine phosphatase